MKSDYFNIIQICYFGGLYMMIICFLTVSEWWWNWADSQAKEKLLRSKRFIQVPTPVPSKNILWFKSAFSVKHILKPLCCPVSTRNENQKADTEAQHMQVGEKQCLFILGKHAKHIRCVSLGTVVGAQERLVPWISKMVDYRVCLTYYLSLKFPETEGRVLLCLLLPQ